MQVRFWGTRGSIPTPGPGTVRYGGNTSCVEVRTASGTLLVLDCGTGARALGQALITAAKEAGRPADGFLLIGHTHWDHIQGLPFFAPLFEGGNHWDVYGPRGLGQSLATTLAGQMQYQYFPVSLEQLGASVAYHDLVEGEFVAGDVAVCAQYLNHPALTLGYRLEVDGVSLVYACDHEPHDRALAAGGDLLGNPADARYVDLLRGADVVIHDTQYLAEDYAGKVGWGHSTMEYAVDAARVAGVGMLVLTHHDPGRDDDGIDELLRKARAHATAVGYEGRVIAAWEGMTLELSPSAVTVPYSGGHPGSAMCEPVESQLCTSVVVAAEDPDLRATILAAADAEHLPVIAPSELTDAGQPLVVFDHDQKRGVLDDLHQAVAAAAPARLAVLALTRGRPPVETDGLVTDWLVWPASLGHVRTKLRAAVLRRACRWQAAPLPPDEGSRLRSLRSLGVLDTGPEERFDRLTRQACESLGVPVALVSMVDADRQWFKSRHGTPLHETPRDASLCAHAILGSDVFQVPDLLADERFADNPASSIGHVRFYAGVPLVLSDGSHVGAFCVTDQRPRVLDEDQLATLRSLAGQVLAELETPPEADAADDRQVSTVP